jgi:hypothetical protein
MPEGCYRGVSINYREGFLIGVVSQCDSVRGFSDRRAYRLGGDGGSLSEGDLDLFDDVLPFLMFCYGDKCAEVWDECAFWVVLGAEEAPLTAGVGGACLKPRPGVAVIC